jgi:hypothetical protein
MQTSRDGIIENFDGRNLEDGGSVGKPTKAEPEHTILRSRHMGKAPGIDRVTDPAFRLRKPTWR